MANGLVTVTVTVLPLINGTSQKNGREFAAHSQQYKATAKTVSYQVDIARAYPQEANVKSR